MDYNEFLHTKIEVAPVSGFEVRPEEAEMEQPSLFDLIEQEAI